MLFYVSFVFVILFRGVERCEKSPQFHAWAVDGAKTTSELVETRMSYFALLYSAFYGGIAAFIWCFF